MDPKTAAETLREWHDFYLLAGTAAATLLGLLFIAVTLNADLILAGSRPHTKRVAEQAFQNYIAVLIISMLFLVETPGLRVLTVQMVLLGAVMIVWAIYRLRRALSDSDESFSRSRTFKRLLPSIFGYLLMIFAGWQLRRGLNTDEARLFAFAPLLLLISATGTSWDLLVRVAEIRHSAGRASSARSE
jgi:hypothetical protein